MKIVKEEVYFKENQRMFREFNYLWSRFMICVINNKEILGRILKIDYFFLRFGDDLMFLMKIFINLFYSQFLLGI